MTKTKTLSTSFIALLAVLAVSCSAQKTDVTKTTEISSPQAVEIQPLGVDETPNIKLQSRGYIKPGASVTMSHDFTGFVKPGSSRVVKVTLHGATGKGGEMTVRASSDNAIAISKETAMQKFAMESLPDNAMDISISTQAPGLYYINLHVETVDAAGQKMGRAFTIPIQVGDSKFNPPTPKHPDLQTTPEGEKLIIMDAEE